MTYDLRSIPVLIVCPSSIILPPPKTKTKQLCINLLTTSTSSTGTIIIKQSSNIIG
jgi:hypothetical protein